MVSVEVVAGAEHHHCVGTEPHPGEPKLLPKERETPHHHAHDIPAVELSTIPDGDGCTVRSALIDRSGGAGGGSPCNTDWESDNDLTDHRKGKRRVKWTKAQKVLFRATVLATIFMLVEIAGGYLSQSVAIISDAAHMFSDVSGYVIALAAAYLSSRGVSKKYPYGYKRVEVLGALLSVLLIWIVTLWLVYEACQRLVHPEEVNHKVMVGTAALGIVFNVLIFWSLGAQHHHHYGMPCSGHHGDGGCSHAHKSAAHIADVEAGHCHGHGHGHEHSLDNDSSHGQSHDHQPHPHSDCKHSHAHHRHGDHCGDDHHDDCSHSHASQQQAAGKESHGHGCNGHGHVQDSGHHGHGDGHGHDGGHQHGQSCRHDHSAMGNGHGHGHDDGHGHGKCNGSHAEHHHGSACHHDKQHEHSADCGHDHENLNVRGAVLHALGDLLQSIGVLMAGLIMWVAPSWWWADPVATLFFSIIVFWTTKPLIHDILAILMQRAPASVNAENLEEELQCLPGVSEVTRLSVWSLSSGHHVAAAHVRLSRGAKSQSVLPAIEEVLAKHSIRDTTIQTDLS